MYQTISSHHVAANRWIDSVVGKPAGKPSGCVPDTVRNETPDRLDTSNVMMFPALHATSFRMKAAKGFVFTYHKQFDESCWTAKRKASEGEAETRRNKRRKVHDSSDDSSSNDSFDDESSGDEN
jgi:hypothetical protein